MAKIVLSALISDMRGSLGGSVIANWKGRAYIRQKSMLVGNPMTGEQVAVREYFADSVALWRGMTQIQKALWEEYAQSLGSASASDESVGAKGIIPKTSTIQSGMNAFIGANQMVLRSGFTRTVLPPTGNAPAGVTATDVAPLVGVGYQVIGFSPAHCLDNQRQKVAIWQKLDRAGAHAHIIELGDALDVCPAIPTPQDATIESVRVGAGHTVETVPIANLLPIGMWVQMVTMSENGRKGPYDELRYLWLT